MYRGPNLLQAVHLFYQVQEHGVSARGSINLPVNSKF